jgi:hypothetical protein
MRADVHGGPEHTRSNQRPDTLMQDRKPTDRSNLLQRTAAPYIWVALSPSPEIAGLSQKGGSPTFANLLVNG